MVIEGFDLTRQKKFRVNVYLTINHPDSHNDEPVMIVSEWSGVVMSHSKFVELGARVVSVQNSELELLDKWLQRLELNAKKL